jgi:hypothetical protein
MNSEEKLTAIIGIRVYPSWKSQMTEEALERGKTLSEYVYELIETGWEKVNEVDVKQRETLRKPQAKQG